MDELEESWKWILWLEILNCLEVINNIYFMFDFCYGIVVFLEFVVLGIWLDNYMFFVKFLFLWIIFKFV